MNLGAFEAAILIVLPVAGLRPVRAARLATANVPKPLIRKPIEDEIEEEMNEPENQKKLPDSKFITKAYKYLRKLGYIDSQYEFSEQFLNKNKYYYGMILCEERHPSIDSLHNLIKNISVLNDGLTKKVYLDRLYEEGEKIITQRLFRYF